MSYRRLFIFVEGADDERFMRRVVIPLFQQAFDHVDIVMYAEMKTEKISSFIASVLGMGAEYIFTADLDSLDCPVDRRRGLVARLKRLSIERIAVVIKEIEGWYLAGTDLAVGKIVDEMTKEQVLTLVPTHWTSVEFLIDLLDKFDYRKALENSRSFGYFYRRYVPVVV